MLRAGVETISHLRENGRITVLFNAFVGPPKICRLFGKGTFYEIGTPEYDALLPLEKRKPGSRAVIIVNIHKVGTSCGYAVPFYQFKAHRSTLLDSASRKEGKDQLSGPGEAGGMKDYWRTKNKQSIDGLPGLTTAPGYEAPLQSAKWKIESFEPSRKGSQHHYTIPLAAFFSGCFVMYFLQLIFRTYAEA